MSRRNKRSGNPKAQRLANAAQTQSSLIKLLEDTTKKDSILAHSSARQILSVSRKHRLSLPGSAKTLLCRKCSVPFAYGTNVRTRIKYGMKIITCLNCENVRRYSLKSNAKV